MRTIMQWFFYHAPHLFDLFTASGPILLLLLAAVVWYLVVQALTQRAIASRRDRGPFLARLGRWMAQPVVARAAARALTAGERVGVLERIATDRAERAEIITLPAASRDAA
jgi:hypothetical protein